MDERLKHNYTYPLVVPPKGVDKIWYPDLFVSNEKRGELHEITQVRLLSGWKFYIANKIVDNNTCMYFC